MKMNAQSRDSRKKALMGESAHREISSKLRGCPAARQLSLEVYNFYGNYLSYFESKDFTSTLYVNHLQHEPIALKSVEIQLQTGTDRSTEALAHELLHLRLPMLGFPLGEWVEIPFPLDPYAGEFLGMGQWVLNLIQHEINFQSFSAMGFDKKHFLTPLVEPVDSRKRRKPEPQMGYPGEIDFPRCCIEYLRYVFIARHGGHQDFGRYAQDVLDWGSRLHPELKPTVAEISRWFEEKAFKDPSQYPRQVNGLLELMRVPKFTGWVILELSAPQKPVAVRLTGDCRIEPLWTW
jgi:hypothetical protein